MDISNSVQNPNAGTLTVAELASIFGISSQAVRLYHKEGLLMPVSVDENGYRRYSYNQIHTLAMICYLRKVNQPIAKIRAYLQNDNVADSLDALHGAIDEMKLHQQEIQRAIDVLENKVQFVEQQLSQIGEGKPEIHTYPMRFYVRLGTEFSASSSSAFFRYPTLVKYESLSGGRPATQFGAFLDSTVPEGLEEIDQLEIIPKGRYLTVYLKGPYQQIYSKLLELRRSVPALKLADQAYCVNVIDQFLRSSQSAYVVRAQIRVLAE